jgi:putative MATE family efflux protein
VPVRPSLMRARTDDDRARDRRIAALAIPALGALAIEPLYVLVDTAIVGRLGAAPLGGLALAGTVLNALLWVCNFLSYGTTARISFLTGKGDHKEAAAVATQGLWLCGLLGVPIALIVGFGGHGLASALGGHGDVLAAASTYLRISAVGIPFVLVALVGHGHLRGLSDTRTPLRVVLLANVVNVVLEVVLVYGFDLGVAGSAWGTVVAQVIAAIWFLAMSGRRIRAAGAELRPRPREIRTLLVIGRHLFARTGALVITISAATSVAARVGTSTLGGHQIALQVETFLALVVDALAIAAQAMIGTLLGAGDRAEARATGRRLLAVGWLLGVALAVMVVATAPLLPHIFSGDAAVTHRASLALVMVGIMQIPGAVAFVIDGILMGASDFRFLQWATAGAGLAMVPAAAAVVHWHRLGIVGVWTGMLVWMVARAVANGVRFRWERWMSLAG